MHFQSVALTQVTALYLFGLPPCETAFHGQVKTRFEVSDTKAPLGDAHSSYFFQQFNKLSSFFDLPTGKNVAPTQIISLRHYIQDCFVASTIRQNHLNKPFSRHYSIDCFAFANEINFILVHQHFCGPGAAVVVGAHAHSIRARRKHRQKIIFLNRHTPL